jgi:hypothetical protein
VCVDCVLASLRIAQVDPSDEPLPVVVLSHLRRKEKQHSMNPGNSLFFSLSLSFFLFLSVFLFRHKEGGNDRLCKRTRGVKKGDRLLL